MGRTKKKLTSETSKGGPRGGSAEVSAVVDGKKGGIQRTRKHLADSASGLEEYFIEDIIAMRWTKGRREWLVRWKGYGAKDDTWEPIEHLAGARSKELNNLGFPNMPVLARCVLLLRIDDSEK